MGLLRDRIIESRQHSVDEQEFLLDIGAIEPTEDGDDLQFTDDFEASILEYVEHFDEAGVSVPEVAKIFDADPDEWVKEADREYVAFEVIHQVFKWPSEAALVVDAAIEAALDDLSERWETDVPARQRYRIIMALRGFQDTCFFCDGQVSFSDEPVDSCCEEYKVISMSCDDCGRRFLEFSTTQVDDGEIATVLPRQTE